MKADWLAAGKGVVVPETIEDAEAAVRDLFAMARAGSRVVLEERLEGIEVSAFALVSDATVVPLAAARDYKRFGVGDTGPNTGGMGAFAPVPWFGGDALERTVAEIFEPIAWRMARDGTPYRGVLYAGLMLTDDGPMVLEFNARFGDPEAQVLLPLLDGELSAALLGTAIGDRALMEGSLRRDRRRRRRRGRHVGELSGGAGHREALSRARSRPLPPTTATSSSSTAGRDGMPGVRSRRVAAAWSRSSAAGRRSPMPAPLRIGPSRTCAWREPGTGRTSASYMSTIGRISATRPGDLGTGRTSSAASSIESASRT